MGAEKKAQMAMSEFESALDDGDGAAALATGREILDMLHSARSTIHSLGVKTRQLELTDAEREAIAVAAAAYADDHGERFAATLRSLLERTKRPQ